MQLSLDNIKSILYNNAPLQFDEEGDDGPISEALSKHGGDELEGWYWSSSEENDENAWNIKDSGNIGTEEKDKELKVRAVRAF